MFNAIRSTLSKTRWVHVSTASTVVVNLAAFAMSVVALTDLAGAHGVPAWQAWLLPIVLEGLVLASTAGTVSLSGMSAAYAWVLMILSMLTSGAGNVVHAYFGAGSVFTLDSIVAMVIAGIPPLWLLLSTHLTVMLINNSKAPTAAIATAAENRADTSSVETAVPAPAAIPGIRQMPIRPSLVAQELPIVAANKVEQEVAEPVLVNA